MNSKPRPHREKLLALLDNDKLPATDLPRVQAALTYYEKWVNLLNKVISKRLNSETTLLKLVKLLNIYKFYI